MRFKIGRGKPRKERKGKERGVRDEAEAKMINEGG